MKLTFAALALLLTVTEAAHSKSKAHLKTRLRLKHKLNLKNKVKIGQIGADVWCEAPTVSDCACNAQFNYWDMDKDGVLNDAEL